MKQFIRSLLTYFFVMFFVITILNKGITAPTEWEYLVVSLLSLSLTVMVVHPLLKFLTIKTNFLTFFIMCSLLLIGVFYLLKLFMVGFFINEYVFEGMILGSIQVQGFVVSPIITIVAASVISSLICSIYREVDSV